MAPRFGFCASRHPQAVSTTEILGRAGQPAPAKANRRTFGGKEAPLIRVKRVYETPESYDSGRFLVERLWPRGIRKNDLLMDGWQKEFAVNSGRSRSKLEELAMRLAALFFFS